jgi:hypothetical protein
VEETAATTPQATPAPQPAPSAPAETVVTDGAPGFAARGRLRRRVRFLRKARELGYRDLGGLVFNLHRFGQRNDQLVLGKLATLGQIDTELRALEASLREHQPVTVLREAGLTACPRCAAIHGSEDRFCPNCGLPLSRNVDLPIAGPAATPTAVTPSPASPQRTDGPSSVSQPGAPTPAATAVLASPVPPITRPASAAPAPPVAPGTQRQPSAPGNAAPAPTEQLSTEEPTEVVRPPSGSA